jgi:TROVE domain
MAKFNRGPIAPNVTSPVKTEDTPTGLTHEGAPGFARDQRSELFLLAVTNMVGENTFYESADARDARFRALVRAVAVTDPQWLLDLVTWLRAEGNLRSAPLVAAVEAVHARLDVPLPPESDPAQPGFNRRIIDAACQRADEPGELLAYWSAHYGRAVPKPVKRGLADAVRRLYTQYALLKYDTVSHGFRFGDVIDLVHPTPDPNRPEQGALFRHALDRRHGREIGDEQLEHLPMLRRNRELRANAARDPRRWLDAQALNAAGATWEDALSAVGSKVGKKELWEALIRADALGYMAALRNLRNMDEAGVDDGYAQRIIDKIKDPDQVARSRQLPLRFLSAYRSAPSLRWGYALELALNHSLRNIAPLGGRTLILVDRSGSMWCRLSDKSDLQRADAAALFGSALATRCAQADLVEFGTTSRSVQHTDGESVLKALERYTPGGLGGTDTRGAMARHYQGHDRVVVLTDEQAYVYAGGFPGVYDAVPKHKPVYTFNLAGYRLGSAPSGAGNRHTFGGLTDACFRLIPLLEAGRDGAWPWMPPAA